MNLFNQLNQSFLWASCIWGGIAMGYWAYGWKQRSLIPFLGGVVMMAASFLIMSALWMSVVCMAAMFAVWWLMRHGY